MKIIKIFCMQKNEDDILEYWIVHHAKIVGYNNIYIVDNMSTNSKDIYKKYPTINVSYSNDYKNKGDVIYNLIKNTQCDIAIPLDIDEFIVYNDKGNHNSSITSIRKELQNLPNCDGRYSFKYYLTSLNTKLYYKDPIKEIKNFRMEDLKGHNKKFFIKSLMTGLDHGNHYGFVKSNSNNNTETNLVLVHYHFRGIFKLIEKCKNDIKGLNIVKNINNIDELEKSNKIGIMGNHNIKTYLNYVKYGAYYLLINDKNSIECDFNFSL